MLQSINQIKNSNEIVKIISEKLMVSKELLLDRSDWTAKLSKFAFLGFPSMIVDLLWSLHPFFAHVLHLAGYSSH